jgi:hypothetical protein
MGPDRHSSRKRVLFGRLLLTVVRHRIKDKNLYLFLFWGLFGSSPRLTGPHWGAIVASGRQKRD